MEDNAVSPDPKKSSYQNRYYYKIRFAVLRHYSSTDPPSCECCGITHPAFLAIDHIYGGGTRHAKSINRQSLSMWLWRNGLPDGYRILCHNCNHAYGHYGKCPHKESLELG